MSAPLGLRTVIQDAKLISTSFGNERDKEVINKIIQSLIQEEMTVGNAMAVLDAARTTLLGYAMDAHIGLLRVDD